MSEDERPKEDHEKLVGRTIANKFRIEKLLGAGAMGAVYLARQTALEKNVAVKVLHARLASDKAFATRFQREAKAASRLDHASSVRVIDFGEEPDGLLYLAMEYLEGRNLYDVIHQDWPLSRERTIDILSQALAALAVAHDMGVIHRDLKPENMMILASKNDEGQSVDVVKVCDFGIAKITDSPRDGSAPGTPSETGGSGLTTQGMVVGTPEYMSPEQAKGESLDARADLYSMGIILYQLLTGRVPFQADSAIGIVLKHVMEEPKPPSEIHPTVDRALETICLKSIKKAKEDRYQSARELRADLRAVLEGRPLGGPVSASASGNNPKAGSSGNSPALQHFETAPTVAGPLSGMTAIDSRGPQPAPTSTLQSPTTASNDKSAHARSTYTVPLIILGALAAAIAGAALGKDGLIKLIAPRPHFNVVSTDDGGVRQLDPKLDLPHISVRLDDKSKPAVTVNLTSPSASAKAQ